MVLLHIFSTITNARSQTLHLFPRPFFYLRREPLALFSQKSSSHQFYASFHRLCQASEREVRHDSYNLGHKYISDLRNAVERAFPNHTLIIPQEAGLAVLRGAVLFGFEPRIISTRICKATYGVQTMSPFKKGTDPEDKKIISEGDVLCQERFNKHVEIHQAVGIDEEFGEHVYVPLRSDQTTMTIEIWTCV